MPERRILVFGATGALGHHVLRHLVARGVPPGAVTTVGRNTDRLGELDEAGFGTVALELSDASAVVAVVAQHAQVVLISGGDADRVAQHRSVIDAAAACGVEHLYYTSGIRADEGQVGVNADHKATEDALIASGVRYTILRNTWYIENYLQSMNGARYTGVLAAAVGDATVAAAVGDATVAAASREDLGEALAVVVTTPGHDDVIYSLSGDTDFSYVDIANAMSVVLGREVTYEPVSPDELRQQLVGAGLDDGLAGFLVELDATIGSGTFSRVGDDLTRLIGRPTTGLVEGLTGSAA